MKVEGRRQYYAQNTKCWLVLPRIKQPNFIQGLKTVFQYGSAVAYIIYEWELTVPEREQNGTREQLGAYIHARSRVSRWLSACAYMRVHARAVCVVCACVRGHVRACACARSYLCKRVLACAHACACACACGYARARTGFNIYISSNIFK